MTERGQPTTSHGFSAAGPDVIAPGEGELIVNLEGFEGPLDLLLSLARDQKVDLRRISMVALVDQYLAHVAQARRLRLELAADYLVMAAWLAYLKSRLLLPEPEGEAEPTGAELAAALAFQLQRLEAMQRAGAQLMALPRLRGDFFLRGGPQRGRGGARRAPAGGHAGASPARGAGGSLRQPRRHPGLPRRRLGLSHRARSRRLAADREGGGAQIVARRGRNPGDHRLPPAGDPGGDRGDPRRGAVERHARHSARGRLDPAPRAATDAGAAGHLGDQRQLL